MDSEATAPRVPTMSTRNEFAISDLHICVLPRSTRSSRSAIGFLLELASRNKTHVYVYSDKANASPCYSTILSTLFPESKLVQVKVNSSTTLPLVSANSLHIFASDFVRHSSADKFLYHPQQATKIKMDDETLQHLTAPAVNKLRKYLATDKRLCSDPHTLVLASKLAKSKKLVGRVLDYFDNEQAYSRKNRYLIQVRPMANLTSFASIAFHVPSPHTNALTKFESDFMLGFLKSHVLRDLSRKRFKFTFPSWHRLSKIKSGVCVSTLLATEPYCEACSLEDGTTSSAELFVAACERCKCAGRARWHTAGRQTELTRYTFSVEIIEPRSAWRSFAAHRAASVINLNSKDTGACLEVSSTQRAVFLPSKTKSFWESERYLESLGEAATKGGKLGVDAAFRTGKLYLFRTQRFVWKK